MAMFDWNDEELTHIIWGEARESDDHIVPYPDQNEEKPSVLFGDSNKKETNQEASNVIPVEKKKPSCNNEHGSELVGSYKYDFHDPSTKFSLDSWPDGSDPSKIIAAKADQESMGTAASNSPAKNAKSGLSTDETAQFNKDSEFSLNPPDDREQGDFIDYSWANIGSFDDLDRIFSNDDQIFGDLSVGNTDKPWSSSKDVNGCTSRPTLLSGDSSDSPLGARRTSSDRSEIKDQYTLDSSQSFISVYENLNEIKSHAPPDVQASIDTIEHSVGKTKRIVKEKTFEMVKKSKQLEDGNAANLDEFPNKGNRQKRLQKGQKLEAKSEVRQLHDLCATWSSSSGPFQQVNNQFASSMVNPGPSLVLSQQRQFQRPEAFQQKHFSAPLLASPLYGNMVYHYPVTSILPQFRPVEGNHELMNANSLRKSVDAAVKPPAMTPKEKIEKLRRRQQLRAIVAIQKQQQQFGNQVSAVETSTMEGGNVEVDENLSSFTSLDQNSPVEHDDNNTVSMAFDNCSVEESVLYRLQDTISKLDIRVRLCLRDSLFRLAQSAIQRQCPSDTSSGDDILSNKDINNHERFTRMHNMETDTNPIDRTVAHLLFHRPLDVTGKLAETPNSPVSANLTYETKSSALKSLAKGYFPESFENPQISSPKGSKTLRTYFEKDQSKNSPFLDTHENASNNEAADCGLNKSEAPKSL